MPNVSWSAAAYPRLVSGLLAVYSVCLLAGTYTHVRDIVLRGFLAAPVPLAIGLYWNTLILLDPLAVGLLWRRPKAGIVLTAAIMVSDLSVNTWVYLVGYFGAPTPRLVPLSLFEQSLFGLFVFVTGPLAYQRLVYPMRTL